MPNRENHQRGKNYIHKKEPNRNYGVEKHSKWMRQLLNGVSRKFQLDKGSTGKVEDRSTEIVHSDKQGGKRINTKRKPPKCVVTTLCALTCEYWESQNEMVERKEGKNWKK